MKKQLVFWTLVLLSNYSFSQDQFRLLLFTNHDDWHFDCIPPAVEAFREMSYKNHFKFEWTQRPDELASKLPETDVLVFLNSDADELESKHIDALKGYMNNGGGFVAIHASSAGKIRNPWFDGLIGGVFIDHPQLQAAKVVVEDEAFPANWHLPKNWLWSDEWYNFTEMSNNLNIILSVDESTYDHTIGYDDIPLKGMGENHPIAWTHNYDGGRVFYTSLGHKPQSYKNQMFLNHIWGGIYWASRKNKP